MNDNLFNKMKELMKQYGFINDEEVEFNSFKLSDESIIQVVGEIEVDKEIFQVSEESGERIVLADGEYKTDTLRFSVVEGKVTEVNERFVSVTTVDGVVLNIDGEVAVGNAVMVVMEEGEEVAPDGSYELEDGTKFEVLDGVISSIGEDEPEEEPAPEDVPEPEVPSEMDELFELLKTFVENVSTKLQEMENKVDSFQSTVNELKDNFEAFKKEPASTPISTKKVEMNSDDEEDSVIARIRKINKNKK